MTTPMNASETSSCLIFLNSLHLQTTLILQASSCKLCQVILSERPLQVLLVQLCWTVNFLSQTLRCFPYSLVLPASLPCHLTLYIVHDSFCISVSRVILMHMTQNVSSESHLPWINISKTNILFLWTTVRSTCSSPNLSFLLFVSHHVLISWYQFKSP